MRKFHKFFAFTFFISTLLSHVVIADNIETAPQESLISRSYNAVKTTAKITTALGLALCAHIITELPIVYAHEYGHYFGYFLTGSFGGVVNVECKLGQHLLAVFMPFFGSYMGFGKESIIGTTAGPLAGMASNYAIMVATNALHKKMKYNLSNKETLQQSMSSPRDAYKDLSNEITRIFVEQANYKILSFSDIFMMTFNILKSSKMFGEFIYGLTPISIPDGDGDKLWKMFGLKKDLTVNFLTSFALGAFPTFATVIYGVARGVYLNTQP
ncbi:MAG TPA: hypothetical protein PLU71_04395 [Candidatus Dependentiae bacterium]|nr:hypothetical protein [Candidatus Dependentiae bacterium]HRQ63072.1 hypothetical protein [Candidatus Dependentiae bacterium]